jgi:hypothetical protein
VLDRLRDRVEDVVAGGAVLVVDARHGQHGVRGLARVRSELRLSLRGRRLVARA